MNSSASAVTSCKEDLPSMFVVGQQHFVRCSMLAFGTVGVHINCRAGHWNRSRVGSSFIVLVSFIWGIFILHEHNIHSKVGGCFALFCRMLGLMRMSCYSSPEVVDTSGTTTSSQSSSHGLPPSSPGRVYHGLNQDTHEDDPDDLPPIGSEAGREGYKSSSSRTQPDSSTMDSSSSDENDGVMVTENIIGNNVRDLWLWHIYIMEEVLWLPWSSLYQKQKERDSFGVDAL